MIIWRKSQISGKMNSMELDVCPDDLLRWYSGDGYLQDIFPHLSDDEREFLMTGATPEEWDEMFDE